MKLLIVRYGRERGHDDPEPAAGFRQATEKIAGVPGLVWKLWGYDDDQRVATSIYLFDSESNARAWGDGPMVPALSTHPGITNIEVRYFDVDQERSTVTRAPMQAAQPVCCVCFPLMRTSTVADAVAALVWSWRSRFGIVQRFSRLCIRAGRLG